MTSLNRLLVVLLVGAALAPSRARAESADAAKWLIVSDIHLDPFVDPSKADTLAALAPEKWASVLATADKSPVKYGSDSGYDLFKSALTAMHEAVPAPPVVLIAGDLLVHDFRDHFEHAATKHDQEAFESFVDRTIAFVVHEFRLTFPNAQIVPTLGNNDADCGDYGITPNSPFLAHYAKSWKPLVDPRNATPDFEKTFSAGGYAVVPAADSPVRFVLLNSVFLSRKFKDPCGVATDHPGDDEMQWLQTALASAGGPTWILTHIPPGIDARASTGGKAVSFYAEPFVQPIVAALTEPGSNVKLMVAGHTHGASFRLTHPGKGAVPIFLSPAVSPIFRNNPAFAVVTVSRSKGLPLDVELHALQDGKWTADFRLSSVSGTKGTAAERFAAYEALIGDDPRARDVFEAAYVGESKSRSVDESNWRSYWCAIGNLDPDGFQSCMSVEQ